MSALYRSFGDLWRTARARLAGADIFAVEQGAAVAPAPDWQRAAADSRAWSEPSDPARPAGCGEMQF